MNRLVSAAVGVSLLVVGACSKKEPRPVRTEPWLAHPSASAAASESVPAVATRYALSAQSVLRFEVPARGGALRGSLTRITGELSVNLADLSTSRGQVRADLASLTLESNDAARLERALSALDVNDGGASPVSSFELAGLEDLSVSRVEEAPGGDTPFVRRARGTAIGNLLLHGFRVTRRVPLEVEFGFGGDRRTPSTLAIRSRTPLVISLETHAIRSFEPQGGGKAQKGAAASAREVRVTIELYGTKID